MTGFLRRAALATSSIALLSMAGGGVANAFELKILHTNDVHDRLQPINRFDAICSAKEEAEKACFGGVARLATAIAERRGTGDDTLLLDAGDWFQGTLFYIRYKGANAAEMVGRLGYDAMTVGNHEFDDGPPELARFADALDVPLLSANLDTSGEDTLAGRIGGATIVEKAGQRIGIIGLTTVDTAQISSAGPTVSFADPVATARAEVEKLRAEGIDKIIVLSHLGYEIDKHLAAEVEGVDAIVGGHSHSLLSNTDEKAAGPYPTMVNGPGGAAVPIVQAYAYSKYLGELTLVFDDTGAVTSATGAPVLLDAAVAEDPELQARVAELSGPLDEIRNRVVAETAGDIDGSRETCRAGECQMGNLVADAMLARVADQGVTMAITNGGGLRASIDSGKVTQGEVLSVLPFQNTLSTFRLSGADIVAGLENGFSQTEEGGGRFPQVAGLQVDWTDGVEPGAGRVLAVRVRDGEGWSPIDPAAEYLLASNNFMRNGGDGYSAFTRASEAYDFGPAMDEVVTDYLVGFNGSYQPYLDGRIAKMD